ncbi:MAG TPA: glycosyltransferase family 4 protein [Pyrinomonadaceae bacterium]|nr:glycosyltransferase family 4 protein [Pyrinomonadaceae bacterium]
MIGVGLTTSTCLFAAAFLASSFGVAIFIRWSRHRGLFDIPNERSSHSTPTPRGGGLVVVLVSLAGYLIVGFALGMPVSWGYVGGSLLVAFVSWLDDLYSLPFWSRLIFHVIAAGILMCDLGYWTGLYIPFVSGEADVGNTAGVLLTFAWVVWLLNAYNFMDGIDGIAALQAVITCIAWAVLALILDIPSIFLFSGILASASAGFLVHNWQPAKVFMGDVGSAFLGFTLAAMPLLARPGRGANASILPALGLLLVWFFIFDTVFTFFRRLIAGQRFWEAHRQHIYQKLVISGWEHSRVALLYGLMSAAASAIALTAFRFSGIYRYLAFLSVFVLTSALVYLGARNKR